MSRLEPLTSIAQQLNDIDLSDSDTSSQLPISSGDQFPARKTPARRSSWLKEVGTDNSRRHSSSFANQPSQHVPPPLSQTSRSQSFSVGQQHIDDPGAISQKRFSSAFSALSESAIEDEHSLSLHSNSSKSNSVVDAPLMASAVHTDKPTSLPNLLTGYPQHAGDTHNYNSLGQFPSQFSPEMFDDPEMAPTFYVVQFKLHRADVYMYESSFGLTMNPGDLVMVEADRGIDLGKIVVARVKRTTAQLEAAALQVKHHQELLSFSRQSKLDRSFEAPAISPFEHAAKEERRGGRNVRQILRKPRADEIIKLRDKEGQEAKARRIAHNEAAKLGFNIEILDAEFQFDFEKLTISYYAETYIHFNNLVNSLYKYYKTRIWMSNVCQSATAPNLLMTASNPAAGMVGAARPPQHGSRFNAAVSQNVPNQTASPYFDQFGHAGPDQPPQNSHSKSLYDWGPRAAIPSHPYPYMGSLGQIPPDPSLLRAQQELDNRARVAALIDRRPDGMYYSNPDITSPRTYERFAALRGQQSPQPRIMPQLYTGPQPPTPWNPPNARH